MCCSAGAPPARKLSAAALAAALTLQVPPLVERLDFLVSHITSVCYEVSDPLFCLHLLICACVSVHLCVCRLTGLCLQDGNGVVTEFRLDLPPAMPQAQPRMELVNVSCKVQG